MKEPRIRAWHTESGVEVVSTDLDPASAEGMLVLARSTWHPTLLNEPEQVHEYRIYWDPARHIGSDGFLFEGPAGTREDLMSAVISTLEGV